MIQKKSIILGISYVLMFLLVSCSNKTTEKVQTTGEVLEDELNGGSEEELADGIEEDGLLYGFSTTVSDLKDGYGDNLDPEHIPKFQYNGKPVEMYVTIQNDEKPMDMGVLIFVNGIIQKYSFENETSDDYLQIYSCKGNETIQKKCVFTPTFGIKGDTLYIRTVFITNPYVRPTREKFSFAVESKMSSMINFKLKINSDICKEKRYENQGTTIDMTKQEISKYIYTDPMGNKENLLLNAHYNIYKKYPESIHVLLNDNNELSYKARACGGSKDEDYYIYTFINGRLLEDETYMMNVKEGTKFTDRDIKIDCSKIDKDKYDIKEFNTLASVAIPRIGEDDGGNYMAQGTNVILKWE